MYSHFFGNQIPTNHHLKDYHPFPLAPVAFASSLWQQIFEQKINPPMLKALSFRAKRSPKVNLKMMAGHSLETTEAIHARCFRHLCKHRLDKLSTFISWFSKSLQIISRTCTHRMYQHVSIAYALICNDVMWCMILISMQTPIPNLLMYAINDTSDHLNWRLEFSYVNSRSKAQGQPAPNSQQLPLQNGCILLLPDVVRKGHETSPTVVPLLSD